MLAPVRVGTSPDGITSHRCAHNTHRALWLVTFATLLIKKKLNREFHWGSMVMKPTSILEDAGLILGLAQRHCGELWYRLQARLGGSAVGQQL